MMQGPGCDEGIDAFKARWPNPNGEAQKNRNKNELANGWIFRPMRAALCPMQLEKNLTYFIDMTDLILYF